jgi:DNA-binding HxlR family transcriptional regulator
MDLAMSFIRGKWKAVILCNIHDEPKRFLELQRYTGKISHKVLNEKLKELEMDGLIKKKDFKEIPPRVEYHLTDKGQNLMIILKRLEQWAKNHHP